MMNGMYVIKETPPMIRQRNLHVRASVGKREEVVSAVWVAVKSNGGLTDHALPVGHRV